MKRMAQRIAAMNRMYNLPIMDRPGIPADLQSGSDLARRIENFQVTLTEELDEGDDLIGLIEGFSKESIDDPESQLDILVHLADWLCDLIVYCMSEAAKFGIPVEDVLHIIMDSNESKLGEDGKPIHNEHGKFMKGPNYWKPEPKIRELLEVKILEYNRDRDAAQAPLEFPEIKMPEPPVTLDAPLDLVTKATHREQLAMELEAELKADYHAGMNYASLKKETIEKLIEELRK